MKNFFQFDFIIFILAFPNRAFVAANCMPNIIASDEVCIQIGYNPSIPDPNAKTAMNVTVDVSILVSVR
jgi:hypothetical protein